MAKKPSYNHTRGDSERTPCAKCKPKPKKKPVRFMTVELPPEPMPESNEAIVAALTALQLTPGWQYVRKVFETNIDYLTRAILTKTDPASGKSLTDAEIDEIRFKREVTIEVAATPTRIIKDLAPSPEYVDARDPYLTAEQDEARRR